MTVEVRFKALSPELGDSIPFPKQMSEGAAGMDVCAALEAGVVIQPGERGHDSLWVRNGGASGYEVQVRPRSGLTHGKRVSRFSTRPGR